MLARRLRVRGRPLRQIPTRSSPFPISSSAFGPHFGLLQRTTRTRASAFRSGRDDRSLYLQTALLKSTPWSFLIVVGASLTAALLLNPYSRQINRTQPPPPPSPQVSTNQTNPDNPARALPCHPRYSEMPVPPGHLGNLTPEQELKLREFWSLTLKTFGVKDPSLTPAAPRIATVSPTSSEPNTDTETTNLTKKASGKKRHSLFSSKKHHNDDPDTHSNHSAPGIGDEDDKYGQTKEFQQTLKELTPEELHSAFWSMVKSDHPDALLLRFLRARKWDVQRALVMLVSTMRWRSKEIHVDDDIMRSGEGGALADSKSGDNFAKKEGEDFLAQMRKGKSFLHGVDKEGRPLCFVRVRLHRQGDQSDRAMERYTVFVIETARLVLQPPVETAVCIIEGSKSSFGLHLSINAHAYYYILL
jgi:CRAL/TRIO, N-terminal domain/CRAL/TRIO domain